MGTETYYGETAPIDYGELFKISQKIGRLEGRNEFYTYILKMQEERAKVEAAAREAAAEEAAAEDVPDESNGGEGGDGFWSSVRDNALGALTWTVDQISRPLYGVSNAVDSAIDSIEESDEPWWSATIDQSKMLSAAKDGFLLKDKKTFADVVTHADEIDGSQDLPDWAVGTIGLAGDIFLDPTTYLGVGLVKSAVKGGAKATKEGVAAIRGGDATSEVEKLVDDLTDLRIPAKVTSPTTGDAAALDNAAAILDRESIKQILNQPLTLGRAKSRYVTKKNQADMVRHSQKQVADIIEHLKVSTGTRALSKTEVKKLSNHLKVLATKRLGDAEIDKISKETFEQALKALERKGKVPELPVGTDKLITKSFDETITEDTLRSISKQGRLLNNAKRRASKNPTPENIDKVAQLQDEFDKATGSWWKSYTSEAFRRGENIDTKLPAGLTTQGVIDTAYQSFRQTNRFKQLSQRLSKLSADKRNALNAIRSGNLPPGQTFAGLERAIEQANFTMKEIYDQIDNEVASRLEVYLGKELIDQQVFNSPELKALRDTLDEKETALAQLRGVEDGPTPAPKVRTEEEISTNKVASGNQDQNALIREISELRAAEGELVSDLRDRYLQERVFRNDSEWVRLSDQIDTANAKLSGIRAGLASRDIEELTPEILRQNPDLEPIRKELNDLTQKVSDLKNTQASLENKLRNTKATYFRTASRKPLRKGDEGFDEALNFELEQLTDNLYADLLKKAKRSKAKGGADLEVYRLSGGKTDLKPRIEVNGKWVTYDEFTKLKNKPITPAHVKQAADESHAISSAKGDEAYLYKAPVGGENSLAKKTQVSTNPVGTKVTPETIAFRNLFEKQHGKSLKEFGELVQRHKDEAKRGYIVVKEGKVTRQITKTDYVNERLKNVKRHRAQSDVITISLQGKKHTFTRAEWKKSGRPEDKFDQRLSELAKQNPKTFRSMVERQWDTRLKNTNPKSRAGKLGADPARELSKSEHAALRQQARSAAEKSLAKVIAGKEPLIKSASSPFQDLTLKVAVRSKLEDPKTLLKRATHEDNIKIAQAKAFARTKKLKEERDVLEKKINQVKQDWEIARREAFQEVVRTNEELEKRLLEQFHLNMVNNTIDSNRTLIRLNFMGSKIADIPTPSRLFRAVEKGTETVPFMKAAQNTWAKGFHAGSKLEPELNTIRLRAMSRTPELIKLHLEDLKDKFGRFSPTLRKESFNLYKKGGRSALRPDNTLDMDTAKFFDDYVDYLNGSMVIGDEVVNWREINRWLPDKFKFDPPGRESGYMFKDGQDMLKQMTHMRSDTDPFEAMWRLSMAAEQAMTHINMRYAIKQQFGIFRNDERTSDLVKQLQKTHEWETVRELGDEYVFAPEVADQIRTLLDMMKPQRVNEVIQLYDRVLNSWKAAVTIYNPGFYTRNGIGETIMGLLDGVKNPRHYRTASRILSAKMPDSVKESLKTLEPWKKFDTPIQASSRPAIRMKSGRKLSIEETWVLYSDNGLRSGFVSTDFEHHFPLAGSYRASSVGRAATKLNDKVRKTGEKFEDYFRLAHFISRMERSPFRDPQLAAKEAAEYVRKFHFDYTDFTNFEKSVMVRLFPFYKWNRKSLPLMAGMLFTKPGAMMVYPKTMQNVSYATGATDPTEDINGIIPNYDEVIPDWMRSLYSYPINFPGTDNTVLFNVSTPQFDALKGLADPKQMLFSLLTPGIKVPIEEMQGKTLAEKGEGFDITDQSDYLMRQAPQTSFVNKLFQHNEDVQAGDDSGESLSPRIASFLTGLGFYENTPNRRMGELLRLLQQEKDPERRGAIGDLISRNNND